MNSITADDAIAVPVYKEMKRMNKEAFCYDPEQITARAARAFAKRERWQGLWQECYRYTLAHMDGFARADTMASVRTQAADLYDATACDATDQLAASMLGELTPPWGEWFALVSGDEVSKAMAGESAPVLEKITATMRRHFDHSALVVELHQCFMDLIITGNACLLFEEAPTGEASAFRLVAVPLASVAFEENADGVLDTTFRRQHISAEVLKARFKSTAALIDDLMEQRRRSGSADAPFQVLEAVIPDAGGYAWCVVLEQDGDVSGSIVLAKGRFDRSPFINFRWMKVAGEIYGRSPVMKILPDIKTANKVVELILKNASIAVTGIWQADDDGVLNLQTVELVPGTIIPKAVGSQGLTPLAAPGRFDVSEIILGDLRRRIQNALLVDHLGQVNNPTMTATEVLERAAASTRLLGAVYGRLQAELLYPLVRRGLDILVRRGDVPPMTIDGCAIAVDWRSPLSRVWSKDSAGGVIQWLEIVQRLGPEAVAGVDPQTLMHWLARAYDVPENFIRNQPSTPSQQEAMTAHAYQTDVQ